VIGVDQVLYRRLELAHADVAAIGERQLVRGGQALHVASGLGRTEIAAIGEHGQDVALERISQLRLGTRERTQVA
jgi:hypothetical protein